MIAVLSTSLGRRRDQWVLFLRVWNVHTPLRETCALMLRFVSRVSIKPQAVDKDVPGRPIQLQSSAAAPHCRRMPPYSVVISRP